MVVENGRSVMHSYHILYLECVIRKGSCIRVFSSYSCHVEYILCSTWFYSQLYFTRVLSQYQARVVFRNNGKCQKMKNPSKNEQMYDSKCQLSPGQRKGQIQLHLPPPQFSVTNSPNKLRRLLGHVSAFDTRCQLHQSDANASP